MRISPEVRIEQVGVGHVRRVEMAVNVFFGDAVGADVLELHLGGEAAEGVDQSPSGRRSSGPG